MNGANRVNGVPLHDAYNQYLAYHEGKAGYARGTYRNKAWLPPVARDVEAWAVALRAQLSSATERAPIPADRLTVGGYPQRNRPRAATVSGAGRWIV